MIRDATLLDLIRSGAVRISPLNMNDIQPVSYDVHLGSNALVFQRQATTPIDLLSGPPKMNSVCIPQRHEEPVHLRPGGFLLGEVLENLVLASDVAAILHGKSTLGRIGLFVHVTAGLVDPGWGMDAPDAGHLTVELFNASPRPIRLWAGMPIGQLEFTLLDGPVRRTYGHVDLKSHYALSQRVRGSAGFKEEP
jgi:dCTP deaminase